MRPTLEEVIDAIEEGRAYLKGIRVAKSQQAVALLHEYRRGVIEIKPKTIRLRKWAYSRTNWEWVEVGSKRESVLRSNGHWTLTKEYIEGPVQVED